MTWLSEMTEQMFHLERLQPGIVAMARSQGRNRKRGCVKLSTKEKAKPVAKRDNHYVPLRNAQMRARNLKTKRDAITRRLNEAKRTKSTSRLRTRSAEQMEGMRKAAVATSDTTEGIEYGNMLAVKHRGNPSEFVRLLEGRSYKWDMVTTLTVAGGSAASLPSPNQGMTGRGETRFVMSRNLNFNRQDTTVWHRWVQHLYVGPSKRGKVRAKHKHRHIGQSRP